MRLRDMLVPLLAVAAGGIGMLALVVVPLAMALQGPDSADCCLECKICKQCQANAKALAFPPREGWHLVLPTEAIDGDTVRFYWLVRDVGRLHGINAPELKDAGGPEAKAYLQKLLPGKPCPVQVFGKEKYGRALIDLYVAPDVTASKKLISAGHARPWDGKGARP